MYTVHIRKVRLDERDEVWLIVDKGADLRAPLRGPGIQSCGPGTAPFPIRRMGIFYPDILLQVHYYRPGPADPVWARTHPVWPRTHPAPGAHPAGGRAGLKTSIISVAPL